MRENPKYIERKILILVIFGTKKLYYKILV